MGPKIIHSNVAKDRDKLKRLFKVFMDKKGEVALSRMTQSDIMKGWEDWDVAKVRSRLRDLVEKATVGRTPELEGEIAILACVISYLHDNTLKSFVDKGWCL